MSWWGDLWVWPLQAAVWGDIATWVGAVGTSGAAIAAAVYYITDRQVERKSQATQVYISHHIDSPTARGFDIVNNSDKPIFEVSALFIRRSHKPLHKNRPKWQNESDFWHEYRETDVVAMTPDHFGDETPLKINAGSEHYLPAIFDPFFQHVAIVFRDANGRRWMVDMDDSHYQPGQLWKERVIRQARWGIPATEHWALSRRKYLWRSITGRLDSYRAH